MRGRETLLRWCRADDEVGAPQRKNAASFGKRRIVTDQKTDAPDRRVGHDPGIARVRPGALGVHQMSLAINRDEAFRPDQAGAVVDRAAVALSDACDKIHLELRGQAAE